MASLQQVLKDVATLSDDDRERLMAHLLGRQSGTLKYEDEWRAEIERRINEPEENYEDWDEIRDKVFPRP